MPYPKKRQHDDDDDDAEEFDEVKPSKAQREAPTAKKEKKEPKEQKQPEGLGEVHENDQGEKYVKLGEYRRLTVRSYQGRSLVDIRDYYKDKTSGDLKPGAKGVSLTPEQWKLVKDNNSAVDELLEDISK